MEDATGTPAAIQMVGQLAKDQETVTRTARQSFPLVDEAHDEPAGDLLTQRMQAHERTAWMLSALLAGHRGQRPLGASPPGAIRPGSGAFGLNEGKTVGSAQDQAPPPSAGGAATGPSSTIRAYFSRNQMFFRSTGAEGRHYKAFRW